MNDRVMQFRVGVVVLATLIITALLTTLNSTAPFAWLPWGRGHYEIAVEFDQAPGIGPNTPVRRNGILIGRVSEVLNLDKAVVVVKIDDDQKIRASDVCLIRASILGDATLDFARGSGLPSDQMLADGTKIIGTVVPNPLEVLTNMQGDLSQTVNSLGRAGDEVAALAERVNRAFGTEEDTGRVARFMDKMELALDNFSQTMNTMEGLFGDTATQQRLRQGIAEMPDAIHEARLTMRDARETLQSVEKMVASADRNLKNLEGITEPFGERGEEIARSIIDSVEGIDQILEEFTLLAQSLNNSEGTLGLLLHDRQLHDNLNRLLANSNQVVVKAYGLAGQLEPVFARLRPIVEDARVFMDKIAREPGRIVGGALNRGPGIK